MTSHLFLRIDAETKRGVQVQYYVLRRLPEAEAVRVAWELVGDKGKYVVTAYKNGLLECTCRDFTFRQRLCKHILAAQDRRIFPCKK